MCVALAGVQLLNTLPQAIGDLAEDLKSLYYKSGVKDDGVLLVVTDNHIRDERSLLLLNSLLSSGDLYSLFTPEERDNLLSGVAGKVKAAGFGPDKQVRAGPAFVNDARSTPGFRLIFVLLFTRARPVCVGLPRPASPSESARLPVFLT